MVLRLMGFLMVGSVKARSKFREDVALRPCGPTALRQYGSTTVRPCGSPAHPPWRMLVGRCNRRDGTWQTVPGPTTGYRQLVCPHSGVRALGFGALVYFTVVGGVGEYTVNN